MWRGDDEALLARLEDERLLERLWRFHVGEQTTVPVPHPRASGMLAVLRKLPGGPEAAAKALFENDFHALGAMLEPKSLAGLPPELCHHLAIYYARVADAVEPHSPDTGSVARVRSLAGWLALAEEGKYLATLATEIAGGAIPSAELARVVDDISLSEIDELGRRADEGAHTQSYVGRAALRALARVAEAGRLAGASGPLLERARRRAQIRRATALDAALAPIGEALDEASAKNEILPRAGEILGRTIPIWQWAEYDEAVEIFVVERITDIAWEHYSASRWDALRVLLAPFHQMVDSLESRIRSDASRFAYAAPCAQMLVFRSELESTLPRQIEVAERVLLLHPTHRNGRLVMASYLCDSATRALEKTPVFVRASDLAQAEAQIERAEKLYPTSKKIEPAKQKLAEAKRRIAVPFG
jgi:hypothetical protein